MISVAIVFMVAMSAIIRTAEYFFPPEQQGDVPEDAAAHEEAF